MLPKFSNEPYLDFSVPENAQRMQKAIAALKEKSGAEYEIIIGGKRLKTKEKFQSFNPSDKKPVGTFQQATVKEAEAAVKAAWQAFEEWRFVPAIERASIFLRAARIMRQRRFEFDAAMVLEVGKNWVEADADFAEAVDFLEFYSREAIRYDAPCGVTPYPGEIQEVRYIPLGVGLVIPPWNFPCAIMAGMTTAAAVSGNTVILKPASDAPLIAALFMECLEEAGLPAGVVNFLTGPGSTVGNYLVEHPKTRFISFTGSKDVGLRIVEAAGKTVPGQIWIKRVVAEMGGKDCIIVDSEADLNSAVEGVVVSAFGYQGQKCSACSRLILDAKIHDEFLDMLIPRIKKIKVGPVEVQENWMGPVINQGAFRKIMEYISLGKKEGKLLCGGKGDDREGYFIQPTVFADVKRSARIAQEEIFGPVLAVIKARNFTDALDIANSTEYGLTGALYTRNREKILRAKREFHVGNLYFNRKCTGALVDVQPFGGFNMSGTDSKAGGRDYLLLFLQAKSMTERF
ncbi:MAG: L-glutamate gamma-semialdehyde dehydrogenase [candidate division WOR-3 bacterium]|jgi:1-pyrroline-5-carboxylate dehydrogenase|nr:L-glutamate gamma-semialdehyde dehydrogenase [candidate division WOR-3 bacterium]MCR4424294.1 L-glutamate gamma-semialdehyde dehydrogenase [candidate division WOR-3 bacterium]MDH7519726.1 L-glutamate gamma-semialdehyde dehydrogenase [bacterium]